MEEFLKRPLVVDRQRFALRALPQFVEALLFCVIPHGCLLDLLIPSIRHGTQLVLTVNTMTNRH
jgi:hypothetical protein